jgi:SAM-dependent methyltransferase
VLTAALALVGKPIGEIDFADVGAGTGILTRMLSARGVRSTRAVEPNDDMRQHGIRDSAGLPIEWQRGSGEETGLVGGSCDLLSMASSFHWVDFERATQEFHRVLRPGGRFFALWNPRYLEHSPLLLEIEAKLSELKPQMKRVSSGSSTFAATLGDRLWRSPYFTDVVQLGGRHFVDMPVDDYIGVWWSVNDIRVQLGEDDFARFMDFVADKVRGLQRIEVGYQTVAWSARRA